MLYKYYLMEYSEKRIKEIDALLKVIKGKNLRDRYLTERCFLKANICFIGMEVTMDEFNKLTGTIVDNKTYMVITRQWTEWDFRNIYKKLKQIDMEVLEENNEIWYHYYEYNYHCRIKNGDTTIYKEE